ncbi:MAG: LLM class flavin-dependent oxidoreductase, partial [Chloroflexi bacterium]|nr:LLM class flavin-dependent oxidoreductase [Chloroflexota bacterium]
GVRIHQRGYSYEALKEVWTEADRLGYYSGTLMDLLNSPVLECWTTLSALAAVTERIRLTPMVLANTYRPPALLAKMSSTLDVISGGRLELGIGAGGGRTDHVASGYTFPSTAVRVRMLEEGMEVIKKLWTGERVDHQGRFYQLEQAVNEPKPVQQPHPPVLIGGHGERHLLRAVAKHADICNIGSEMSLDEHRAKLGVLEEHCREIGRDPAEIEVTHNTRVVIAETRAEFDRTAARAAASADMTVDAYKQSLKGAVAGTPEECIEKLDSYVAAGIRYFFLIFPDPVSTESLRLFAERVMPHFAPAESSSEP